MGGSVSAENGVKPQYGGTLEIGTVYVTLSALSWDPADWNWKLNHDTGLFYEQLFAADLSKSRSARRQASASSPTPGCRPTPSAASWPRSWEWKQNPLRVEIKLRKGVMFPEKPGVMKSRELTAEDVVFSFNRLTRAPRSFPATSTIVDESRPPTSTPSSSTLRTTTPNGTTASAGATTRAIYPKEVVDAGANNWKNVNGTGPFMLTEFIPGNSNIYTKNPIYWDKEKIGGQEYKLPFVDKITYRTIKDEATFITALRTGKLDMLESDPLAARRRAEEERAAAAVEPLAQQVAAPSWRCASTPSRSTTSACAAR